MIHKLRRWISQYKIIYFVFLLIQNIVIFSGHYFNKVGFPWDFDTTDYAWPAFSTTSISMGIFPQWVPYEAMGYPLAINVGNGLYYPPYWIFSLLHIPFTLEGAVILQVLTVLLGSFGMFMLLNLILKSPRYALVGAVAFQFFGGFYSNAEHSSIIIAFAIAPWLFYVFKLDVDEPKITRRVLFIPIIIYFLVVGGYFGNLISTLFIIPVFLFLQLARAYSKAGMKLRTLKIGGVLVGLMILGISLSSVFLGPIWQERDQLTRVVHPTTEFNGLWAGEIPAFFMSSRPLPGEPSMTSTFVTLPLLVFASFVRISTLKKYWTFIAVLILSILMVGGPNSPFWQIVTSALPTLKLSRFPSSDYRVFVAIPLIILGTAGLRTVIERQLSWKEFGARAAFVATWFSVGVYFLYSNTNTYTLYANVNTRSNFFIIDSSQVFVNFEVTAAVFILAASISFITYYVKKNKMQQSLSSLNKPIILSFSAFIIIVLLILSDGFRVISDMQTWKEIPFNARYVNNNVPLEKNGKLITYSIFQNIPSERPPRENCCSPTDTNYGNFSWKGYLQGTYMMQDYTNEKLLARSIVESNNLYRQYMLMKWSPLLLPPSFNNSTQYARITLPVSAFSNVVKPQQNQLIQPDLHGGDQFATAADQVAQTRYGINDIAYKVYLKEPRLMVENEIYFPGWQADLIFPNKIIKLEASVVNNVFRAWLLPAGDYTMVAHYNFPNLIVYEIMSVVSFAIWIFIMARFWKRLRQPIKKQEVVRPAG